uniref:Major facilitator superfamily (MFS) profile domain-containing protein n=1 Tax=Fagus sylvatica TaxID=28930 RepID=A0A2N9GDX9_FAGSY
MEEELVKKPLIVKQEPDNIIIGKDHGGTDSTSSGGAGATFKPSDSRATVILIISTFVAACSTFTGGSINKMQGICQYDKGAIKMGLRIESLILIIDLKSVLGANVETVYSSLAESGIIADLGLTVAEGVWLLDFGRLSLGFGFGLTCYVGPVYLAEITPKNLRGGFMSIALTMTSYGASLTLIIGSFISWRTLAIIGSIPCLLLLLGVFLIPESPRWLAKIGKEREFEAALQRLRGQNADISQEASDIIVGVGLMIVQGLGGLYGFVFYMSEIFDSAGISSTVGFIVVAILQIPAIFLGAALIDKFGRRTLLMASAIGECLGCLLTGLSYLLQDHNLWKEVSPILALLGVLVYLASYSFGMGGIPWIIISEIFPINVKGSAGTLCNLVCWICSWIVSYTFNFLFEWSSAGDASSLLTSSVLSKVLIDD